MDMDPSTNPPPRQQQQQTIHGENDCLDDSLGEVMDGVVRRDGEFELDQLLDNTANPEEPPRTRRYDEHDYHSHRREGYLHPRYQHPASANTAAAAAGNRRSRTRGDSSNKCDPELLNLIEPFSIIDPPPPPSGFEDLSEETLPKRVQFEIGGSNFEGGEVPKRKNRKHHHHHHSYKTDHNNANVPGQEEVGALGTMNFESELDSMDDLDQENLSSHRFGNNKRYRKYKHWNKMREDGGRTTENPSKPMKYDHKPHEIFVELDVLSGVGEQKQWKEAARWIKYEEDVLEGSDRWGRPHVASLSFHSLINLLRLLEYGVTLFDIEERDLPGVAYRAVEAMAAQELIRPDDKGSVMRNLLLKHKHVSENEGWRFNLRRNTATSGSLTSLHHAFIELDKNKGKGGGAGGGLGSPSTVPDNMNRNISRIVRRNSAVSRLVNDHHGVITVDVDEHGPHAQGELSMISHLSEEDMKWVTNKENLLRRIPYGAEASIVLVGKDDTLERPIMAFIRLAESSFMPNITEVPIPVRFIFILLGPSSYDLDYKEIGRSISTLMSNTHFHDIAYKASDRRHMLKGIHEFLDESIVLPPGDWDSELFPFEEMKEKQQILKKRKDKRRQSSIKRGGDVSVIGGEEETGKPPKKPPTYNPLKRSNRLFGGMINDMRHRYRLYISDLTDGFNFQTLASIIFIYFACVSGAIAFGGILGEKTEKHIGISETLIGTAAGGLVFSIFSGQPLIILGTTGPLLLFDESLYNMCKTNNINFLAFRFWIGVWVIVIGAFVVAFDGSAIARYFTRFIQEIFGALISFIFIYGALLNIVKLYVSHPLKLKYGNCTSGELEYHGTDPYPNTALLSTSLCIGTFLIGYSLRLARSSGYFTSMIRELMGNFAVPLAVLAACFVDYMLRRMTHTEKLNVPDGIETSKPRGSWLVDISSIDAGMVVLAVIPAALVFILMFMETCICALLIGNMRLMKGGGFHLDIFLICLINGAMGCIGGSWLCAATVRAMSHASSLVVLSTNNPPGEKPQVLGVKEQRVSSFVISLLTGLSVLMSPILKLIPMSVLFGVFLYMGISSMSGVQFFQRCSLLLKQVANHPQVEYVRKVKTSKMHLFTIIQILCLGTLFGVRLTPGALAIPFLLILLVPLRLFGLTRIFKPSELEALDGKAFHDEDHEDDGGGKKPSIEQLQIILKENGHSKEKEALMSFVDADYNGVPPTRIDGTVQ